MPMLKPSTKDLSRIGVQRILSKGIRIWESAEPHIALDVGLYECAMLSEMTTLNEARAGLIADIQESGSVYGR
jgi:uncharacterized protein